MDSKKTVGGKAKESRNKKQATPSQVRASHEKQQKAGGKQASAPVKLNGKSKENRGEKQLEAKVKSLHEQADKSLGAYSKKASEMRNQISAALERQDKFHKLEQLNNVDDLRESILELTGVGETTTAAAATEVAAEGSAEQQVTGENEASSAAQEPALSSSSEVEHEHIGASGDDKAADEQPSDKKSTCDESACNGVAQQDKELPIEVPQTTTTTTTTTTIINDDVQKHISPSELAPELKDLRALKGDESVAAQLSSNCFEPLSARLDPKSKYVALRASLERHFVSAPHLLEPICQKFLYLTGQIDALTQCNEQQQLEVEKLTSIKQKLGDLCRELQKSNNQIRIESLDIIKGEQNKAKEQAVKIQSTLSGVMRLFDENQQRNLTLKQENVELQNKLKALLEHCDNWEKCVETTLKQREIENRLAKTEMARLSLIRNEEKEKFFKEKSELLRALTMMKEQQSKIEDKEAKLRSDLTNYASKYDECQEIIHKGLSKFQVESKRMLKQIEQGRRDYIQLLNKYEASNKNIKQLLEEKQSWAQSMSAANNKLEALERLCRALKAENDKLQKLIPKSDEAPPATAESVTQTEESNSAGASQAEPAKKK